MDKTFTVVTRQNRYVNPTYGVGDLVWYYTGRSMSQRMVVGVTWYEGMEYFAYWLDGLGHDVPSDEVWQCNLCTHTTLCEEHEW